MTIAKRQRIYHVMTRGSVAAKKEYINAALGLIRITFNQQMDGAPVFSQSQDFAEVASELSLNTKKTGYFVVIASMF